MTGIQTSLFMKAAKFIQNHKIKCDSVWFDSENEVIVFKDEYEKVVAWVSYINSNHGNNYLIISKLSNK